MREHLASAIANCCAWGNNCYEFGRLGAVTPLVGYMMSKERRVHRTTALALCQLSQDPFNCVTLHTSGVVPVSSVTRKTQPFQIIMANVTKQTVTIKLCRISQ